MGFARTCSVALVGVEGVVVEVQADLEPGVAAFTLVGLPDKSLTESRDRVRAAVVFPVKLMCSAASRFRRLLPSVARYLEG
ncbi:magnesium chelatase domain-containing protein [Streptomyces shenzhenensis]